MSESDEKSNDILITNDSNVNNRSILEVTDEDIDEQMAKDNNNFMNQSVDGFDFDTPEEFLLYHSRTGNLKVVEKLLLLMEKKEIELDVNCKGRQRLTIL